MPDELILLVDDEPDILKLGRLYLEREGYRVEEARDGESALREVESRRPALVVLDVMLPKLNGFEVCRRLRDAGRDVAILILTARDEDIDKIVGLELGADDYLTKPFNPRELVARAKAILRRSSRKAPSDAQPIHFQGLEVDPVRREVTLDSHRLDVRTQEFELLAVLARQPGRVFTREQLLQQAWGFDFYGQTRTVDVHVAHLRRKLMGGSVGIETITGVGYKLVGASPGMP
jgi:two-component system, OmpR family, alkaline phosphatase synthesis response regulator PhoP